MFDAHKAHLFEWRGVDLVCLGCGHGGQQWVQAPSYRGLDENAIREQHCGICGDVIGFIDGVYINTF